MSMLVVMSYQNKYFDWIQLTYMKVLVLGSNGLVGKSVSNKLKGSKKVTELTLSNRKDTNLFNLDELKKLIERTQPDWIINCAAKVGGIHANNTYRTEFILENIKINLNLFEILKQYSNCNLINLGSSCIYPLDARNPIKEDYFMTGKLEETNSPYAIAKITGIEMGRALNKDYGNNVLNLMPTNLYGPNDNFTYEDSHVIPGLISRMHDSKIKKLKKFKIWGSGKPLREFMHVDDLSSSIEFLIGKKTEKDLINIGTGEEISIYELALLIKNLLNFKGELIFDSSKPDGNPRKLLDSSYINSLGWKHQISLEDGLENTYQWFLENYKFIRR